MFGECAIDNVAGPFGETEIVEFLLRDPARGAHVVAGRKLSAGDAAEVIDEHVMIFGFAGIVAHDALEDFEDASRFDDEAGFFKDFAADGVLEFLADFDHSAGQGPGAFEGLAATLDQEDATGAEDEGADSQDGARRVAAVVGANTAGLPSRLIVSGRWMGLL